MAAEEQIITTYHNASISDKIEIILKLYPEFDLFLQGQKELLRMRIKFDRKAKRRRKLGDTDVRVQFSNLSDPTAREAVENVMLDNAIESCDMDIEVRDTDCPEQYRIEAQTLREMKEDYRIVKACVMILPYEKAHVLQKYYEYKRDDRQIKQEEEFADAFYMKVYRIKKQIKQNAGPTMRIKYEGAE